MKTAHDEEKLVLLQNLDPEYTSGEVEVKIIPFLIKKVCHVILFSYRVRVKYALYSLTVFSLCIFLDLYFVVTNDSYILYLQDIMWHVFQERCTAKMVQQTAISNPHSGMLIYQSSLYATNGII